MYILCQNDPDAFGAYRVLSFHGCRAFLETEAERMEWQLYHVRKLQVQNQRCQILAPDDSRRNGYRDFFVMSIKKHRAV